MKEIYFLNNGDTMRDIDRINRILNKIEKLWKRSPDMRFGQMLINYIYNNEKISWNEECEEVEKRIDRCL